jgi:hypothetical protein
MAILIRVKQRNMLRDFKYKLFLNTERPGSSKSLHPFRKAFKQTFYIFPPCLFWMDRFLACLDPDPVTQLNSD